MNTEPRIAAEAEEHLLGGGGGGEQSRAEERAPAQSEVDSAEQLLRVVSQHTGDPVPTRSVVPAFPEEFDFGEFRHGEWRMDSGSRGLSGTQMRPQMNERQ
jgi:hypothetical protein